MGFLTEMFLPRTIVRPTGVFFEGHDCLLTVVLCTRERQLESGNNAIIFYVSPDMHGVCDGEPAT